MSQVQRPTPTVKEEKLFHDRNSEISSTQQRLSRGQHFKFSTVTRLSNNIVFMRKKNQSFNIKFGLHKEIA